MTILQANPKVGYEKQSEAILEAVRRVLESGWYILGAETEKFEKEFATFCRAEHCIGVASGTDAVELGLRALGVCPGELVLTVSHTAVATVAAVERCGAIPVLIDIERARFTMCPKSLDKTLSAALSGQYGKRRVAAIVPVHIYGQCADMDSVLSLAKSVPVLEDCAQAHGATLHGKKAGTMGSAGAFSFYPTKNLGAFGDGGAVVTNSAQHAEALRLLRQYGWKTRYESNITGTNSRLDELQSAMLRVRLTKLHEENQYRNQLAALYANELSGLQGVILPNLAPDCGHVYHLYVIRSNKRDDLEGFLKAQKIQSAIHYPLPIHQQAAYQGRIFIDPNGLPNTEEICTKILSLPMHLGLTESDVRHVCKAVRDWERG